MSNQTPKHGDQFQDCAATMTFLGVTDDGKLRFHDALENEEFTLEPDDPYLVDLLENPVERDDGLGR